MFRHHRRTLEMMLVVHGSHVESHGSMMLILSLVIGTVIGNFLKIEKASLSAWGTWLKERRANRLLMPFYTTALTICISCGGNSRPDGLRRHSTLLAKATLDMSYRSDL